MTELTPNIPLLRKTLEWAEAEAQKENEWDREWHQGSYIWPDWERTENYGQPCGTAYCIAGYIDQVILGNNTSLENSPTTIHESARLALGINDGEADSLFYGANSIEDVRRVSEDIAERAGERL